MIRRNRIGFLIILLFCGFNLFSENWISLIPGITEVDIDRISRGKYTDRSNVDYKNGLELLPTGSELNTVFMEDIEAYDPEICVEMLFVIDRPDVADDELMLYLLNNFRAFSDQAGVDYYSSTRGEMHPLIKKSYFVTDKKSIDDPVVITLPVYEEHIFFQKDTTFGSNYYTLKTRTSDDTIWLQLENIDKLKVYFLNVLDEGGERINFIVRPTEDKIVLYALAQIKDVPKIKKVLKWNINIPGSFKTRMNALVLWFKDRVL